MVYGYHEANQKRQLWQETLEVRNEVNAHVLVMGDFNEVRYPIERKKCSTMTSSMKDFDDWINSLGVIDLPLIGRKFTWRRGNSYSKLDRILVESVWMQKINSIQL